MITSLILALAAGIASALMFASIISGVMFAVLLFYLAPLPLMVASLGWGAQQAAIGGIAAGSGLGLLFGFPYMIAFVMTVAVPAWWLGHLATLGRPALAVDGAAPATEWYPPGRLLLWIVGFASITSFAALLTLGSDATEIRDGLRRGLGRMVGLRGGASPSGEQSGLVEALVAIAPAAASVAAIMTLTLNLWLAGRITLTSGRLKRSWPSLSETALPPMTLVALPVALAFCFTGGLLAMIAQVIAAALLVAYALTGLATVHALTRGRANRAVWLSSLYAVVLVFGWPAVGLVALGLTDAFFGLRLRTLSQPNPPT
jgi:hypothetical protein